MQTTVIIIIVTAIIVTAEIINIATYQYFRHEAAGRAKLRIIRHADDESRIMNYLCPGLLGRTRANFNFALPELYGGITLVEYTNAGANPESIARQILYEVKAHGYRTYVFTISYGEQIARCLEQLVKPEDDFCIEVISINPCVDASSVKLGKRISLYLLLPLAHAFNFLAGWLGFLPLLTAPEKGYSITLALSQLSAIAYGRRYYGEHVLTQGLILSNYDELLRNEALLRSYRLPNHNIEFVEATHADTIESSGLYQEALGALLHEIY